MTWLRPILFNLIWDLFYLTEDQSGCFRMLRWDKFTFSIIDTILAINIIIPSNNLSNNVVYFPSFLIFHFRWSVPWEIYFNSTKKSNLEEHLCVKNLCLFCTKDQTRLFFLTMIAKSGKPWTRNHECKLL